MNHVKLLDCTLRDGAYLIDKKFGDMTINGIVSGLVDATVDFIEIGFFQDEGFGEGKTVFRNSKDAKRFIPKDKKGCEFTVLADCSRYSMENLDYRTEDGIDAVRECFFKYEIEQALDNLRKIKEKGYKVFVQPVDILGYTDLELIEFISKVNEIEPYCFSIVDTFGSMYQEDLIRVFELINHNLVESCHIGFHSHNNMQLSNALSQEFVRISAGKRKVIVDGTLSGMGRGAGNTPTELVMQYLVSKLAGKYNIDSVLDVIENYIDNIRSRCTWGYSTPYFIAGSYGAHVNNIAYLTAKNSIRSKDIRYIMNKIGALPRKRYDYNLLEKTYIEYMQSDIDDSEAIDCLSSETKNRNILILVPGKTAKENSEDIKKLIKEKNPIVISVNFIHESIQSDFLYLSNARRHNYWKNSPLYNSVRKITTSNISLEPDGKNTVVSFVKLVKCGWEHMDNSTIMLLRLLDMLSCKEIYIAGFDGYNNNGGKSTNYYSAELEVSQASDNPIELNSEIAAMLQDYNQTRLHKEVPITFVTPSRFSSIFER